MRKEVGTFFLTNHPCPSFGKGGEEVCSLWKRRGGSLLALEKEGRTFARFGKGGEDVCSFWERRGGRLLVLEKEPSVEIL